MHALAGFEGQKLAGKIGRGLAPDMRRDGDLGIAIGAVAGAAHAGHLAALGRIAIWQILRQGSAGESYPAKRQNCDSPHLS